MSGWVDYYGKFYSSELTQLMYVVEQHLRRWAKLKFAKKTGMAIQKQACKYLGRARKFSPKLFVRWHYGMGPPHKILKSRYGKSHMTWEKFIQVKSYAPLQLPKLKLSFYQMKGMVVL